MKKYTEQQTAEFKAKRNAISKSYKVMAQGYYRLLNNGNYKHSVTGKIYQFFAGNRTMVAI